MSDFDMPPMSYLEKMESARRSFYHERMTLIRDGIEGERLDKLNAWSEIEQAASLRFPMLEAEQRLSTLAKTAQPGQETQS